MSGNGDTIAVGDLSVGSAFVFGWDGSQWTQIGSNLRPEDATEVGSFGEAVSIAADGETVAVGHPVPEDATAPGVHVFRLNGEGWEPLGGRIEGRVGSAFGFSLDISADGRTLAVGAPGEIDDVGGGVVLSWDGETWKRAELGFEQAESSFGKSVALSAEGRTFVLGGDVTVNRELEGRVQVYQYER